MDRLLSRLSMDVPVVLAPMGGAVGPELCAAVSYAGGLGMIPLWWSEPDNVRAQIRATRALTRRKFGVNLNHRLPQEERLAVCIEEGVEVISFFWGQSAELNRRAKDAGMIVFQSVGTADEARQAVDTGADVVVAQGWEAGGHVWGTVTTLALVPVVVDAMGDVPVLAAGGIADGRGLAAAFALGASGGWIGTRFLAAKEATVHQRYRDQIFSAKESDTYYGAEVFDLGWPKAPHRSLRNTTVAAWEAAGRPMAGARPGEGEVIARSPTQGEFRRYQINVPGRDAEGDLEAMALWAGQGVGLVRRQQPAAEIVADLWAEARTRIADLQHVGARR